MYVKVLHVIRLLHMSIYLTIATHVCMYKFEKIYVSAAGKCNPETRITLLSIITQSHSIKLTSNIHSPYPIRL